MDLNNLLQQALDWVQGPGREVAIIAVVSFLIYLILARYSRGVLESIFAKTVSSSRSKEGRENRLATLREVTVKTLAVVIFVIALLMILIELGLNVTPVLTGAGVLGIAIGIGAQNLIKDVLRGFVILADDEFAEGDVVELAGEKGKVEDFTLRRTVLRDFDGSQYYVPNSEIGVATNLTKSWSGMNVKVLVSYESDLQLVEEMITEIGENMEKDLDEVTEAPQMLGVDEFEDSGLLIHIRGRTKPGQQWEIMRELRRRIKVRFEEEGIEIPYPHEVQIEKQK